MSKNEFLNKLETALKGLPQKEVNERIAFYSEMIDDYMEEGLSEVEALEKIGSVENIAKHITEEIPLSKIIIEKVKPKRKLTAWEKTLLIVGSPIWLSILISLLGVIFSVYVSAWAVIVSLWSVVVALVVTSLASLVYCVILLFSANILTAIACLSIFSVGLGLGLIFFVLVKLLTKLTAKISVIILTLIKESFIKKG